MRHESLFFLFSSITRIKGVGGATAASLQRLLPVSTVMVESTMPIIRDLLFHLPVQIIDRRFTCPLNEALDGVVATFVVTVEEHAAPATRRFGKKPYKVMCSNDTGDITLVFFNAHTDYIAKALPVGQKRVISGKVERFDGVLQMPHPDIIAPISKLAEVQQAEAVYPLTAGITSRKIAGIVSDALDKLPKLSEWIAAEWMEAKQWPSWHNALQAAHHPQTLEDLSPCAPARMRLAYDEILSNQLRLALLRRQMQQQAGEIITGTGKIIGGLQQILPFKLTDGQKQVLKEIEHDMASGKRMGRLLQGDVGSGKTIVALFSMLRAVEQGLQAALMVPTELVAQQHFETISQLLSTLDVNVVLLTGSVKGKAREKVLAEINSGAAQIIVGTHALFQEHVSFGNLAVVVIDEQHRFGVNQRMALTSKGNVPHLLHMTATPIPRSLTMTIYGDMDISQLKEKPAGRQPIATRVIPDTRYEEVIQRLKMALDRGEKVYWICPLIDNNSADIGDNDIAAAKSRYAEFKARFGDVVGLVHGRMKGDAREKEMQRFASGETRLLVATTVVEVGVDVRDATIMVIEEAERFGLSQLHQLRGRVGRGTKPSACVLLYSEHIRPNRGVFVEDPKIAQERLSTLRDTEDGFAIAEADLSLRGGGDLLGVRQSGLPRFIFTDVILHRELLEHAREDISRFLMVDPELTSLRGQALEMLLQLFGFELPEVGGASQKAG